MRKIYTEVKPVTSIHPVSRTEVKSSFGNPVIEAMGFKVDSVTRQLLPHHPKSSIPVEEILAEAYNFGHGTERRLF